MRKGTLPVIRRQVFEHPGTDPLATILESAAEFGLTRDEIWDAVVAVPGRLPDDARTRYVDELSGDLARRLLEKERRD
jgi:hypothetical protein